MYVLFALGSIDLVFSKGTTSIYSSVYEYLALHGKAEWDRCVCVCVCAISLWVIAASSCCLLHFVGLELGLGILAACCCCWVGDLAGRVVIVVAVNHYRCALSVCECVCLSVFVCCFSVLRSCWVWVVAADIPMRSLLSLLCLVVYMFCVCLCDLEELIRMHHHHKNRCRRFRRVLLGVSLWV